jgi:endonuclease/exonuclease/phosphatase (EEP) superfamily protein YafD
MNWSTLKLALVRRLRIFAMAAGAGLLLPWIAQQLSHTEFDRLYWAADLGAHWQALFGSGLALSACALAALTHDKRWLALLAALGVPWLSAPPALPAGGAPARTIKTVAANLHFGNADMTRLKGLLDAERPDVVLIVEVGPAAASQLAGWTDWPHQVRQPRNDPFGLALLSRHPISSLANEETPSGIPRLRATLDWGGTAIDVSLLHPMPPISADFARERDQTLASEAALHARHDRPALMGGDFNASPWSGAFTGLDKTGFRRATSLFPGTWPSGFHALGIPIDHLVASRHWTVLESGVGPDVGSDHRPIVSVLAHAASSGR